MSSNLDIPSIIIIGLHGKNGSDIIQDSNSLQKYKWYIDNKYYQAEVELYNIKNYNNVSSSILNSSEALIVYIDSSKALALTDVDDVLNGLEDLPVEVKLLVCDGFTHEEDVLSRGKALEWCIEGGWELVELSVEPAGSEHEDDLEDDFVDSWGYTRIRQALNAHTWSNLKLKDKEDGGIGQLLKQATLHDDNAQKEAPYDRLEGDRNGSQRDVCESDLDEFSDLFCSLGEMKEKASALPLEERRVYAEKIAMAFLTSLGDQEDESESDEETSNISS